MQPPEAALKLVSVHRDDAVPANTAGSTDPDMERAATLISLHQSVKLRYQDEGIDDELGQARDDVKHVTESLRTGQ